MNRLTSLGTIATAVALLIPSAAVFAQGSPLSNSGNELLRTCKLFLKGPGTTGDEASASGQGLYYAGLVSGIVEMGILYRETDRGQSLFCLPDDQVTTNQAVRMIVKYLEANPEHLHESTSVLTTLALAFDSEKGQSEQRLRLN
jgi:Rap1a immunity proteins